MKLVILLSLISPLLSSPQCGTRLQEKPSRFGRHIIGGNNVESADKWPWWVAVSAAVKEVKVEGGIGVAYKGCGGTVISEHWILTAAHCLRQDDNRTADVKSAYIRTGFGGKKLEKPLTFDETVSPICLPKATQAIPSDGYAVVIGFGASNVRGTNELVKPDDQLRETIIPIVRDDVCESRWAPFAVPQKEGSPKPQLICAGSIGHGGDIGDSGGPLMMKADNGAWFEIGIASFKNKLHVIEADLVPNMFTDVRKYCDWIEEKTGGEAKCQEKEVTLKDVEIHA